MKPKIYFTSDWHIGHENVLRYDQRPFDDLDEMHKTLVNNFNQYVPKHGITYFLGDMGLCSHGLLKSIVDQLNGTKVLILGNHDNNVYSMYNAGFDVVVQKAEISITKQRVTLSHCPLRGVYRENTEGMRGAKKGDFWHREEDYAMRYSFPDEGQFHLHGHIHSPNRGKSKKIEGFQYDVGVVANKYKPVSISQIESWIMKSLNS